MLEDLDDDGDYQIVEIPIVYNLSTVNTDGVLANH